MTDDLRVHAAGEPGPAPGDFVLYWIQTTHRAHDNFALNFAVEQADALGLPLLVYHGLRHDYPWASDRLHTFILEAVVDLYRDFARKGIQYAFYLERSGDDAEARRARGEPSPLVALARRAALVVTDFFPTFIVPRQTRALRSKVETPVVAVDSCTLVPLRYHDREHLTARGIRRVLEEALPHYLYPVPATPGGPAAGRRRLARFLETGLPRYADARDDPAEPDAVSRLSPYLHFGNVSIHEVLLAARVAGPAEQYAKFQDEALVWRELAHNFVFRDPRHQTTGAIPAWAREQLRRHEADPRPALYSAEELERARTHDELWNEAQRSYLDHGWMHNRLRMLWGKAVLQWTPDAETCLRILEHLNNKYALDGRDPNSYGGIMWIFGKFDRPFYPRPIYGTVRYLSLKAEAKRRKAKQ